tara:strand:- start:1675 stop:2022 length:348 start_codon:yes stop_codon:yes gene_type:complete
MSKGDEVSKVTLIQGIGYGFWFYIVIVFINLDPLFEESHFTMLTIPVVVGLPAFYFLSSSTDKSLIDIPVGLFMATFGTTVTAILLPVMIIYSLLSLFFKGHLDLDRVIWSSHDY